MLSRLGQKKNNMNRNAAMDERKAKNKIHTNKTAKVLQEQQELQTLVVGVVDNLAQSWKIMSTAFGQDLKSRDPLLVACVAMVVLGLLLDEARELARPADPVGLGRAMSEMSTAARAARFGLAPLLPQNDLQAHSRRRAWVRWRGHEVHGCQLALLRRARGLR